MKSNLFLRVIIFLFCLQVSSPVYAEYIGYDEAKQWVEDKGQQLLKTFGETDIVAKYEKLDEMLLSYIDLDYVSRFVMGRYWKQMSPEQQMEYQNLFKRYALSIYKGFPLDFDGSGIGFEIIDITQENGRTKVHTKINIDSLTQDATSPISDIFVDFFLDKKDGNIKIVDLKLGESSLILSYRSRFSEMIAGNDNDIVWFLEDLTDITEAAERTNQEKLEQSAY